jgi:hypothetical protein
MKPLTNPASKPHWNVLTNSFTSKKEYPNNKCDDPFMQALASGGFQVEELARLHHPWCFL